MKKTVKALIILAAASVLCGFTSTAELAETDGKIKAATYYSDEWVINFWNSESQNMDAELKRIKEDGFNTIILCVPWREFQPLTTGNGFNSYALEKLERVMENAGENGLNVMLRLGYVWDYYPGTDILKRYEKLIYDGAIRALWLDYAEKIYDTVSAYENYAGAFITWEDFWNFTDTAKSLTSGYSSARTAELTGYSDYARENYTEKELKELYGGDVDIDNLTFPSDETDAYKIFLEFYDGFLSELLSETQEVFPDLSMEVRLDMDSYGGGARTDTSDGGENAENAYAAGNGRQADKTRAKKEGTDGRADKTKAEKEETGGQEENSGNPVASDRPGIKGFKHTSTYPCGNASYSSNMLSANMGFGTNGELLEAASTAAMSRSILREHRIIAGKPIFCDQFLFTDNTPGYEYNARLPEEELDEYISLMADVFRDETIGYGVWTYRDYEDNIVYNSQFGLDLEGWKNYGGVSVEKVDGSNMCRMQGGSTLMQNLSGRNYISSENTKVSLKIKAENPAVIKIKIGNMETEVPVSGEMTVRTAFPSAENGYLSIHTDGEILIDDVKVYSHITEAGIYDEDGNEGPRLEAIRELNKTLEQ